jgi:hypothetical protein
MSEFAEETVGWGLWRIELLVAVVLALCLALAGLFVDADDERAVEDRSGAGRVDLGRDEERPLLRGRASDQGDAERDSGYDATSDRPHLVEQERQPPNERGHGSLRRSKQLGIREVFAGETKYGAVIVVVALCSQQITGISPGKPAPLHAALHG